MVNNQFVGGITQVKGSVRPTVTLSFIFSVEGLTSLTEKVEGESTLHEVKICKGAPIISHLLFADECFLFFSGK